MKIEVYIHMNIIILTNIHIVLLKFIQILDVINDENMKNENMKI